MIDFTNSRLGQVGVHFIGNKINGDELRLSDQPIDINDDRLLDLVLKYATNNFKSEEFYSFGFSTGEINLNPLYNFCKRIFHDNKSFHKASTDIATHLFNQCLHPQIKAGELFVMLISGIILNGEQVNAIGLFKSDNKYPFVKVHSENKEFLVNIDEGVSIDKIDKACLIFNINVEEGFQMAIVDKSSKGTEAKFWKDDFLNVIPLNDNYQATKIVLDIAKKYVTGALGEQYEVSRADQVDMLNRSINYFKTNEQYDKNSFEKQVLHDSDMIQSFRKFEEGYRNEMQIGTLDDFQISGSAVRQQQRQFKSVIKLDKNFHIYIHGNRDLIEQGIDSKTGKRFYKIYFDEEN